MANPERPGGGVDAGTPHNFFFLILLFS